MTGCVWVSGALSKGGSHYYVLLWLLPVFPVGAAGFAWYILWGEDYNLFILCFVVVVCGVLIHQGIELVRFLEIASRTAKKVVIDESGAITIQVFSNRIIKLDSYSIANTIPTSLTKRLYRRLFPANRSNGTIFVDGEEYYLTGTIEEFDSMYKALVSRGG